MKKLSIVIGAIFALLVVTNIQCFAQENEICGCAHNITGMLRIVNDLSECKSVETDICWNQTGPQGAQGPVGPQGPQGPEGPPGVLSFYTVTETCGIEAHQYATQSAYCDQGDYVVGGGYSLPSGSEPDIYVYKAMPEVPPLGGQESYSFFAVNMGDVSYTCSLVAVCADVTP